jgi:hypothetical protein
MSRPQTGSHTVWLLVQRRVWLCAVVVLLCGGVAVVVDRVATSARTQQQAAQAQWDAQQAELASKQADVRYLQEHLLQYRTLQQQGVVGEPDRTQWVEQLQAAHQQLHVPDALNYTVLSPQPLQSGTQPVVDMGGSTTDASGAGTAVSAVAQQHDVQWELAQSHEDDVWFMLEHMQQHAHGRFRVQSCSLKDPKEQGFRAQCVLRFFTIPLASDVQPAMTSSTGPSSSSATP